MTVVAICSTRSSPGVTSLCVALGAAWASRGLRPLLVEADPAGGVIGLRFAMSSDPSLRTLWADMRRGFSPELVHRNSSNLRGTDCILAPTDPLLASRALEHVGPVLARELAGLGRPVVVDLGRIASDSRALPFVSGASHVLAVTRPRVEDAQSVLYGARLLEASGRRPALVTIGDGPHHPAELASVAGLELAAVLPDDRDVASAFGGGRFRPRKLRRSALWRCIDALAGQLVPTPATVAAHPAPAAPSTAIAPSVPTAVRDHQHARAVWGPRSDPPHGATPADDLDITAPRDDRTVPHPAGAR